MTAPARSSPARTAALIASAVAAAASSGCASLVEEAAMPGNSGYSCAGVPDGVVCTPTRQMYGLTEDADRINKADLDARGLATDGAPDPDASPAAPAGGRRAGVLDAAALVGQPLTPPIAASARSPGGAPPAEGSLRIWIASWRDEAGTLRSPGFLYADLDGRPGGVGDDNLLQTPEMIRAREGSARTEPAFGDPPAAPLNPPSRASPPPPGPRTFSVSS